MYDLSLTACSFWVRNKKLNKNNNVEIHDLNNKISYKENKYNDFMDVFKSFCGEHIQYSTDNYYEKMFKIDTSTLKIEENDSFRYAYVTVNSGGYGIEANLIDKKSKKEVFKRKKENAEILSFKIFFAIPKTKNEDVVKGILIFQNIGQYGIKTITISYLKDYMDQKLNCIATTGNICPEVFVKKLINANGLKKVVYIKHNISPDISDEIGYGKEERTITNFINLRRLERNNF